MLVMIKWEKIIKRKYIYQLQLVESYRFSQGSFIRICWKWILSSVDNRVIASFKIYLSESYSSFTPETLAASISDGTFLQKGACLIYFKHSSRCAAGDFQVDQRPDRWRPPSCFFFFFFHQFESDRWKGSCETLLRMRGYPPARSSQVRV